jgi:hypothetical protein
MTKRNEMYPVDRLVTAAVVGGIASGVSEYAMAKYEFAGVHEPDFGAVVRGAIVGVVVSAIIAKRRGRT